MNTQTMYLAVCRYRNALGAWVVRADKHAVETIDQAMVQQEELGNTWKAMAWIVEIPVPMPRLEVVKNDDLPVIDLGKI